MDADMFAPQVAAFGDTYRIIAMNERGHGGTPISGAFIYPDLARDALGLLDALGIDRCPVIGVSEGGVIALLMALQAPDRVTGLALLGTSARFEEAEMGVKYWK